MESSKQIFKEAAAVYVAVIVAIIVLAVAAQFISFLATVLFAAVAMIFYFVPTKLLERKNLDEETFALRFTNRARNVVFGLGATLLTLPFFWGGFWVWNTQVLDRSFEWSPERYMHCLLYTSPSPRDLSTSRMPSSA